MAHLSLLRTIDLCRRSIPCETDLEDRCMGWRSHFKTGQQGELYEECSDFFAFENLRAAHESHIPNVSIYLQFKFIDLFRSGTLMSRKSSSTKCTLWFSVRFRFRCGTVCYCCKIVRSPHIIRITYIPSTWKKSIWTKLNLAKWVETAYAICSIFTIQMFRSVRLLRNLFRGEALQMVNSICDLEFMMNCREYCADSRPRAPWNTINR